MAGHDSFLDVVTNIVGILILLVMVVGLRASQAVENATEREIAAVSTAQQAIEEDLRETLQTTVHAEKEMRDLIHRAIDTRQEAMLREQERMLLTTMVAEAEQEITERRNNLSGQDQRDFDVRRKLNEAQSKLEELTREQIGLSGQDEAVEEIECEPTPLARVVTGEQTHILLADDHLAVVPFDDLLDQMASDAKNNIWRMKDEDVMERTIGPVGGFRLRYTFVKSELLARSGAGTVVAGRFSQFAQCQFLPVRSPTGEPASEALQPGSEFQQHLQRLSPQRTTVTIWAYPGNYDRLREVKREVRSLGFQIAVRPLPAGMPIGASRGGTDSLTE